MLRQADLLTSEQNRSTSNVTGKKTRKARRLEMPSAKLDDPIYSRGFVIGAIGRNQVGPITRETLSEQRKRRMLEKLAAEAVQGIRR
jgi:hypothetical protein